MTTAPRLAREPARPAAPRDPAPRDTPRDTPPDERFDGIARLARRLFDAPSALIALVDAEGLAVKSWVGGDGAGVPGADAFCARVIESGDLVVEEGAAGDPPPAETRPAAASRPRAWIGQPILGRGGEPRGVLCIIGAAPGRPSGEDRATLRDLAALAERALDAPAPRGAAASEDEGEARLRAIVDNVADGIVTFDARGVIVSLNRAAERLFGYAAADAIDGTIWRLVPPAFPGEPVAGLARPVEAAGRRDGTARNGGFRRERLCRRRDGGTFPAELTVSAMPAEDGALFVGVVRDVSERREAERALCESEARLRAVVTAAPVALFATDRAGVITLSEGSSLAALGLRPGETVGESILQRYDDGAGADEAVRRALAGETFTGVAQVGRVAFETHYSPIRDAAGEVTGVTGVAIDVTDRARAEADLRRERDLVAAVLDTAGSLIAVFDRRGRIARFNRACERTIGRPFAEVAGRPFWEVCVPAEEAGPLRALFEQLDARHFPLAFENHWVAGDGERRLISWAHTALLDADGAPEHIIATGIDVTERKRTEAALARSEGRYRDLFDNATDVVYTHDLDGRLTDINRAGEQLLGYRREELLTMYIRDLLTAEGRATVRALAARTVGGEVLPPWEAEVVARDGRRVPVEFHTRLVRADGVPAGVQGIARDITERKEAERRLRETLDELGAQYREANRARGEGRAVLDAAGEGMALIAPDRRFLTINRQFAELFEVASDGVVGRRFEEFGDRIARVFADPAAFRALVAGSAGDSERSFTAIVEQCWPEHRELQLYSTPVWSARAAGREEHLGRLYVFRDVTREREVDRMKSEFVSLVSHELRTPLTSIKGFVDLLLDGDVGEVGGEQREFLEIVASNADRLVALINDLLDVSRIESGKVELDRQPLDLLRIIRGVAGSLRPQIDAKGQTLRLDLPPALPPILGDADRVTQILTNLLSNAHKYTPQGGALRVGVAPAPAGGAARIDVRDSGIGLSPDEQAQIFTKFFRARNRTTQEVGGTGLGLAITRSLVEMHGGTITLTSAPGAGSTFSFTLPFAVADASAVAPPGAPRWGGRVLVVDDERDIAALIRRYLERAGYETLVAHDGAAALAIARDERPDLITLDINLPGTDGFATLEWLKSDPATAAIPVIMLSILDDGGRGKLLGAVDYLAKPVDERTLLNRVRAILAQTGPIGRPRRVLVADGDRDIRTLIAGGLRWADYDVCEAADGDGAVAVARRERPDLILLDSHLPGLDAVAALRALRADAATRDTPVVMMMAGGGVLEEHRSAIEALGGAVLLGKPCSPEELASAIGGRGAGAARGGGEHG